MTRRRHKPDQIIRKLAGATSSWRWCRAQRNADEVGQAVN